MGKKAYQKQASWPRTLDDLKRKYKTSTTNRFLLLVDGHVSGLSLENVEYAEKLGIDIIIFPGHLTHLIQPEDQVFGKFKQKLRTLNTAFVLRTKGATLTKHQFYGKCARAYEGALTQQLTISAWRACERSVKPETGAVVPDREKILSKLPKAAVERYDKWVADGGKERDDRAALRDEDDDAPVDGARQRKQKKLRPVRVEWAGVAELESEKLEAIHTAIEVASTLMGVDAVITDTR